jgi:hypothetical protein
MRTLIIDSRIRSPVSDKELVKMMEGRGFTKKITRSSPQTAMKWQGVRI